MPNIRETDRDTSLRRCEKISKILIMPTYEKPALLAGTTKKTNLESCILAQYSWFEENHWPLNVSVKSISESQALSKLSFPHPNFFWPYSASHRNRQLQNNTKMGWPQRQHLDNHARHDDHHIVCTESFTMRKLSHILRQRPSPLYSGR